MEFIFSLFVCFVYLFLILNLFSLHKLQYIIPHDSPLLINSIIGVAAVTILQLGLDSPNVHSII